MTMLADVTIDLLGRLHLTKDAKKLSLPFRGVTYGRAYRVVEGPNGEPVLRRQKDVPRPNPRRSRLPLRYLICARCCWLLGQKGDDPQAVQERIINGEPVKLRIHRERCQLPEKRRFSRQKVMP